MDNSTNTDIVVKTKRGRKSKKELMESLNMSATALIKKESKNNKSNVNLNVSELSTSSENNVNVNLNLKLDMLNEAVNNINNVTETSNIENQEDSIIDNQEETNTEKQEEPKILKKRGRKPKGGKIVQQTAPILNTINEKPNIILHLKCSMKDLQTNTNNIIESYNFEKNNDLNYEIIGSENINIKQDFNINNQTNYTLYDDCDENVCKDATKELWKKLNHLEHNLHINNINNKRSCCFWDTCEFDNPPIYIPKNYINGTYNVYGCFCSPECGVAYLMNEIIDSSTKFERYHLFNHIYTKVYNYNKNIKPAPNPYYMLDKYYGNLSIQEYRALLKNDRLFLIVDKPLTRILPELHTDNDDFILNNKIIPSNNYSVKNRFPRKKQNKGVIVNEKFGAPIVC